jgi:SAM-dependent methyltransferase
MPHSESSAPTMLFPAIKMSRAFDVGFCTFSILALELALIRWTSGQIRIVAYFSNLVLLAAFLGMGLGIALGRKRPGLVHFALPALAAFAGLLAFAEPLGLTHLRFPDPSISLWGGDAASSTIGQFAAVTLFIAGVFWAVAGIFTLAATPLGRLFDELPALKAYTADILGSLAGIVAVALVSALGAAPWQWMALGVLPILWFSRTAPSLLLAGGTIGLAFVSGQTAFFSPYNRIDLEAGPASRYTQDPLRRDWKLSVNRDYHQMVLDLSDRRTQAEGAQNATLAFRRAVYELPFRLRPGGKDALVVGAGTGNDVAAALRAGYGSVTAVEIDPTIIELGQMLHPENPYAKPQVKTVNDDARAYFERNPNATFDAIAYGLLDSHAMFSAMSSLRLDNYVYTREGIRAGWRHVKPDGVLAISFSTFAGPWIEQRLVRTIREATGLTPIVVRHKMDFGATFVVGQKVDAAAIPPTFAGNVVLQPAVDESVRVPTDDWPFLYLRPNTVPYGYLTVLLLIGITSTFAIRRVYRAAAGEGKERSFDLAMFLMGAGFMLLETRMVTELSLLFGSTWIVNACVFGGVLVMVLLANLFVSRRRPVNMERWYLPLIASILVTWAIGAGTLNVLGIATRGIVGGLMFALPIGFAGVIVATMLARSRQPAVALGSNLLGAVLGGILEYSSMFLGLKFVALLALVCYVGAYLVVRRWAPATQRAVATA